MPENESDNYSADLFTHHCKFMKPVKNPVDYDGTQLLRDYLKHFERCSVVNGWSKEEAAVFLAASLHGEAQKVLNGLSDTNCRDYKKVVDKLELRFGVEKQMSYTRHVSKAVDNRKMKVFITSSCCRYPVYVQSSLSGFVSKHSGKTCRPAFH